MTMDRRRFVENISLGFLAALGTGGLTQWAAQAQTEGVQVQWLGHTCFLFTGNGQRILVNPFRALGCTAGYREPRVASDLVLVSSRLFDEGGIVQGLPNDPDVLETAGVYDLPPLQFQGISVRRARRGGRQFGPNVIWRWQQGGLNIVHLGAAAEPLSIEDRILLGRPDVLLIPVGGGPKAYNAEQAIAAIRTLNPRIVIPTHFRTVAANAAPANSCDIVGLAPFLDQMRSTPVRQAEGDSVTLTTASLPGGDGMIIQLFSYRF